QRLRDAAQPCLLELQRRAATRIAGKQHRHPVCALAHRMSLQTRLSLSRRSQYSGNPPRRGWIPGGTAAWRRTMRTASAVPSDSLQPAGGRAVLEIRLRGTWVRATDRMATNWVT